METRTRNSLWGCVSRREETWRSWLDGILFVPGIVVVSVILAGLPFVGSFFVSFAPVIVFVLVGGITPIIVLGLGFVLVDRIVLYINKSKSSRLSRIRWVFDFWFMVLLPFHSLMILAIVALFSLTWSAALGFFLYAYPQMEWSRWFENITECCCRRLGFSRRRRQRVWSQTEDEHSLVEMGYSRGSSWQAPTQSDEEAKFSPQVRIWPWFVSMLEKMFIPVVEYFPIRLHMGGDDQMCASPNERTMYLYSPHGVYAIGLGVFVFREASGLNKLLPNSRPVAVGAASAILSVPGFGILSRWAGFIPASRNCIEGFFACKEPFDLVLAPGGIAEAMEFDERNKHGSDVVTERVVLRSRKGFIRVALKYGVNVRPVFCFGESQNFIRYSIAGRIRRIVSRTLRIIVQPFRGRWFTLIPFNVPMDIVIGPPIKFDTTKEEEPSQEEINHAHAIYCQALESLFNDHKKRFRHYENAKLVFV